MHGMGNLVPAQLRGAKACNIFKVQNASAICCTGSGSCKESFFKLQPDPSCGGDVCCSESSCQESSFRSVRSMACLGDSACEKDTSVTLTGDLIVGAGAQAGGRSTFTFINAGNHCVRNSTFLKQLLIFVWIG